MITTLVQRALIAPEQYVRFTLTRPQKWVRIQIYDDKNNKIRTMMYSNLPVGARMVYWDGKDDAGKSVIKWDFWVVFIAKKYYVTVDAEAEEGAYVYTVDTKEPAKKAGNTTLYVLLGLGIAALLLLKSPLKKGGRGVV